jgi:hypothetical protein
MSPGCSCLTAEADDRHGEAPADEDAAGLASRTKAAGCQSMITSNRRVEARRVNEAEPFTSREDAAY